MYEKFERLRVTRKPGGILDVVCHFDGPANIYDAKGHTELADIWPVIDRDPDARVAVLRGHAGVLASGAKPEFIASVRGDWHILNEAHRETREIVLGVINCAKPVVSAIEGMAVGGALSAALVSDISIAGRTAKIVDPHTQLGIVAGDGAAIAWPLLCGLAKAKLYLLTGAAMDGVEAERIGLVSMVVDDDRVTEVAFAIAERIAAAPESATNWTKLAINQWLKLAQPMFEVSAALEFVTLTGPDIQKIMDGDVKPNAYNWELPKASA